LKCKKKLVRIFSCCQQFDEYLREKSGEREFKKKPMKALISAAAPNKMDPKIAAIPSKFKGNLKFSLAVIIAWLKRSRLIEVFNESPNFLKDASL
jgi:hypothetical protein